MLRILRKLNMLLDKKQRIRALGLLFLLLLGTALEVCSVSIVVPLISSLTSADIIHSGVLGITDQRQFVLACIGALVLLFVLKDGFLILQSFARAHFVADAQFEVQNRLLGNVLSRPYEFFLYTSSGEVLRQLQEDVQGSFELLNTLLIFFSEIVVSAALIVTLFLINPLITACIALEILFCLTVIILLIRPILRREGLSLREQLAQANKWILQSVAGIKDIKVSRKEGFFAEQFRDCSEKITRARKVNAVLNRIPKLLIELVTVSTVLTVIGAMVWFGRDVNSLIPSLGALTMAAIKILPGANQISAAYGAIAFREPSLDKLLESLQHDGTPEVTVDTGAPMTLCNSIVLEDVTFCYRNSDVRILDSASMTVPIGKAVGIVGASGEGKTTAVDLLLGLLAPQQGRILADGRDIQVNYPGWLSCIGYIPQSIFLLDSSIRANVAFGIAPEQVDDEKVWETLRDAQLDTFVRSLPQGLDTCIGERGVRLSGGQRQRIGIARALYADPQVLIFDEATSSLDMDTEEAILQSISALHGRKTLIIIAHRMQTIAQCDLIYRVRGGKIVAEE